MRGDKILEGLHESRMQSKVNESANTEAVNEEHPFLKKLKNDETNKKINAICQKYGYVNQGCYIASWGDPKFEIRPKSRTSIRPEILYEKGFNVMTTSHGYLDAKMLRDLLEEYENALKLIEELAKIDINKLPKEER